MNKPESLRAHLVAAVPELKRNPDRLLTFVDNGSMRSTAAPGLSFEYSYTLNIILTDFAGHPDAVAIPLFAWVLVNQRELMENLEKGRDAIKFEADILDNSKVDLSITLPLTERVIVKRRADGTLQVSHPAEPVVDDELFLVPAMRVETSDGELLAEWGANG
ncbi:phage tail protein [Stutzerimonas zhaodongensis]|uniref:Phage tail protein n=1 Tax=Stutzerimonas zhaodongensis TaxID=1176257 RepID=A0A3M2HWG2_9GAMM|nr:phage tail protein [Stutzerimonas zhaodongensis]MCQ4314482.1 phage tail protein [Stutzerimonas zhaodongensis]RMH92000.1 phage tail protein [Stutzerimonas zhaodongensis]